MKIFLIILVLVFFIGCDDGKPPVVTHMPDGSVHIDKLGPGESITFSIPLPIPAETEDKRPQIERPMTTYRGTPIEDGLPCFQAQPLDLVGTSPDDSVVERAMLLRKAFDCPIGTKYWKPGHGYVMCGPYGKQIHHEPKGFDAFSYKAGHRISYEWGCSGDPFGINQFDECELATGHGMDYDSCREAT